jgi:hypothetical protein
MTRVQARRLLMVRAALHINDGVELLNAAAEKSAQLGDAELQRLWLESTTVMNRILDRLSVLNIEADERLVVQ